MTHDDSGWRPRIGLETYKGHELWDHMIGPHEINTAEAGGEGRTNEMTDHAAVEQEPQGESK